MKLGASAGMTQLVEWRPLHQKVTGPYCWIDLYLDHKGNDHVVEDIAHPVPLHKPKWETNRVLASAPALLALDHSG